jgi:hypothetical protein
MGARAQVDLWLEVSDAVSIHDLDAGLLTRLAALSETVSFVGVEEHS